MSLFTKLRALWSAEKELADLEIVTLKRLLSDAGNIRGLETERLTEEIHNLKVLRENEQTECRRIKADLKHWKQADGNWEVSYQEAVAKLNEQAALNAEFLQQHFQVELDAKAHSGLVDNQKIQVMTQMTVRKLRLSKGLLGALHDAFSLNVATHLVRKLTERGGLTHEPMSAEEYHRLSRLPPGPPRDEPKQLNG